MKVPTDSNKITLKDSVGLIESGTASYYDYNSVRFTANGSKFNPNALTCAYYRNTTEKRKFLNRQIRVCTDTCIILTVTDNGEFRDKKYQHLKRLVDLTPYAFKLLGGTKKQGVLQNVTVQLL